MDVKLIAVVAASDRLLPPRRKLYAVLKSLIKEPLVHFLAAGAAIFVELSPNLGDGRAGQAAAVAG